MMRRESFSSSDGLLIPSFFTDVHPRVEKLRPLLKGGKERIPSLKLESQIGFSLLSLLLGGMEFTKNAQNVFLLGLRRKGQTAKKCLN